MFNVISFEIYCVEVEMIPCYNDLAVDEYQDVYGRYRDYVMDKYGMVVE